MYASLTTWIGTPQGTEWLVIALLTMLPVAVVVGLVFLVVRLTQR